MSKVLVDCYINDNFGDDLFLHMLCNRYKNTKFYTIARKQNKKMFESLRNLKYLSFDKTLINHLSLTNYYKKQLRRKVNKSVDAHITIGGSLFAERHDEFINNLEYNKFLSKIVKNKKNYLIGCNFGEYSSPKFYDNYLSVFSMYDNICFRDKYSYNLFKDSLNNVSFAPDVAFQFEYPLKNIKDNNYILISIIDLESRVTIQEHKFEYIRLIVSYIKKYINQNYKIALFSACHPEHDTRAIEKIKSQLSEEEQQMLQVHVHNNLDQSIKLIAESSAVISTRLHVTILALLFSKKTLPLIYDNKIINLLEDMDYNNPYIDIRELKSLDNADQYEPMKFKISKEIRKNSEKQFAELDSILLS